MFADPMFMTPSLRDNPFLQDHFEREDNQNKDRADNRPDRISHNNRSNCVERGPERKGHSDRYVLSRVANSQKANYSRQERAKNEREQNNPHLEVVRDKAWDLMTDPFNDDSFNPQRLARIEALAVAIERDERRNEEIKANRTSPQNNNKDQALKDRIIDYISDPFNDDFYDPQRLVRIEALAKPLLKEDPAKHLIQTQPFVGNVGERNRSLVNDKEIADKQKLGSVGQIKKSNLPLKDRLKHNLKEMDTVQKAFAKVKEQVINMAKATLPEAPSDEVHAQHILQEHNQIMVENFFRSFCDVGVGLADSILQAINLEFDINYDSKEFLDKHKLGGIGNPVQKVGYWACGVAINLAITELIIGSKVGNLGKSVYEKTSAIIRKVGLETYVATKLATGAIGKGVNEYLPQALGGEVVHLRQIRNPCEKAIVTTFENSINKVARYLESIPDLAIKNPKLAQALLKLEEGVVPFLSQVMNLNGIHIATSTNNFVADLAGINSILPEADIILKKSTQETKSADEKNDTYKNLASIIENIDDPNRCFEAYEEFVYRVQMKSLFQNLNFSDEAIQYAIQKIPKYKNFQVSNLESQVEVVSNTEKILNYCKKYKVSEWVKIKLIEIGLPIQKHYIFNQQIIESSSTDDLKKMMLNYGLDLNDRWNLVRIPKYTKIADEFYTWALSELENIFREIESISKLTELEKRERFISLFQQRIKEPVCTNPLICAPRWYRFWKDDKLDFEKQKNIPLVTNKQVTLPSDSLDSKALQEIHNGIVTSKRFYKLQEDVQSRHFAKNNAVENEKSVVYWSLEKVAEKTAPLIGQGIPLYGKKLGELDFKEIIKFDEICGEAYLENTMEWAPTHYAKVHYKQNGYYHIVPFDPNSKPACEWNNYHGKN